jgi:hypothetical protein
MEIFTTVIFWPFISARLPHRLSTGNGLLRSPRAMEPRHPAEANHIPLLAAPIPGHNGVVKNDPEVKESIPVFLQCVSAGHRLPVWRGLFLPGKRGRGTWLLAPVDNRDGDLSFRAGLRIAV